jgi:sugar phosphate isomerase/epimerase
MRQYTRRSFVRGLATSGMAMMSTSLVTRALQAATPKREFTMDLICGRIGVRGNLRQSIQWAHEYGFESVGPSADLARLSTAELQEVQGEMKNRNLVWGAAGLTVDFRRDDAAFRSGMDKLPEVAKGLQRAGVTRVGTWLRPSHDSLTYLENFKQHFTRLKEVARVLGDHGLRFGLEYVGPKTSWTSARHSFIHTMAETKELIAAIGQSNVGFVLDAWHWYTAHETKADLLTLTNQDVVA